MTGGPRKTGITRLGRLAAVVALIGCGGGTAASGDAGTGGGTAGSAATGAGGTAGNGIATETGGTAGSGAVTGTGGTVGSGGHGGGGVGGGNCRPDILIVQDRSGSMNDDFNDSACGRGCGANSKWSQMAAAITAVVGMTDASVNWGIKYFPDNDACDASMAPAVGIAASNGAAVAASIEATIPGGPTPTRDSISFGAAYLQSLTDTNPKFLLLATDGLPNCPVGCAAMTNPNSLCTTTDNPTEDQAVEQAVMMAASQGIKTFIVGIGNVATAQSTLNQLAAAGGEAQVGGATSYYAALDEATLEAALTSIVGKIAGCSAAP